MQKSGNAAVNACSHIGGDAVPVVPGHQVALVEAPPLGVDPFYSTGRDGITTTYDVTHCVMYMS